MDICLAPRRVHPLAALSALLVTASLTACAEVAAPDGNGNNGDGQRETETSRVAIVYDGDTVELSDGRKVRLLGINAPERGDPYYREARDTLRGLVEGQTLTLERDVRTHDQFGRDLAHLFLEDGTHVNLALVREGFGQVYTIPPNVAYAEALLAAEREAREAGRGLWQPSQVPLAITDAEPNPRGPDDEDLNGEWVEVTNTSNLPISPDGVTLSDVSNNAYRFPSIVIEPGARVRVHTGAGRDTERDLYWGRDRPVWNNGGDTAFLRDDAGGFIDGWAMEP